MPDEPLPTPEEAAARVGKYEEMLGKQPTSFIGSLIEAYGADTNFAETIEIHCADLRALLAERASLAAERDRLAEEMGGLRGSISWIEEPFVSASTPKAQLWQRITFVQADVARFDARAALAQPERREGSK